VVLHRPVEPRELEALKGLAKEGVAVDGGGARRDDERDAAEEKGDDEEEEGAGNEEEAARSAPVALAASLAALAAAAQSDPEAIAYRVYAAEAADTLVVDAAKRQRRRSSALRSVDLDLSKLAKAPVVKREHLGPEQPWSDLDQWRHMWATSSPAALVDERATHALTFAQRWRAALVTLVLVLLLFAVLGVGLLISSPPSIGILVRPYLSTRSTTHLWLE